MVLRRLRMHGFGLTAIFNKTERAFIASRAHKKPIEETTANKPKSDWQFYERILHRELFALKIWQKFRKMVEKDRQT